MSIQMKILYKRTASGAIQIWRKEIDGCKHRTLSGKIDGVQTVSKWTIAKEKNVGKSNYINAIDQAKREVDAAYDAKLRHGGYFENIQDIDKIVYISPMLAKKYKKDELFDYKNVVSQPKLDGIRAIVTKNGIYSRLGNKINSCPHIESALREVFVAYPEIAFDGELYSHSLRDDFNRIVSAVNKENHNSESFRQSEIIEYHIFDLALCADSFIERFNRLKAIIPNHEKIVLVETLDVSSEEDLDEIYSKYLENGYEGQMIRTKTGLYKNGRSSDLLKRKDFLDEDYEIVSINEGSGNRSGGAASITYKIDGNRTFDSSIRCSTTEAIKLLKNKDKYIGGTGTVKYFNLTPGGIPRFPVTIKIYPDKRNL